MYNKLFTKILDSTIWLAPDTHRLVWITLIAAMDQDGIAEFASVQNIALRARVSIEDTQAAVKAFESPDSFDPTQEFEGRRIEKVPGGWLILNAGKYREIVSRAVKSEKSKVRMQAKRERDRLEREKNQQLKPSVTPSLRSVTPSDHMQSRSDADQSRADTEFGKEGSGEETFRPEQISVPSEPQARPTGSPATAPTVGNGKPEARERPEPTVMQIWESQKETIREAIAVNPEWSDEQIAMKALERSVTKEQVALCRKEKPRKGKSA